MHRLFLGSCRIRLPYALGGGIPEASGADNYTDRSANAKISPKLDQRFFAQREDAS